MLHAPDPLHCAAFCCVVALAQVWLAQVTLASWLPGNEQVARLPVAHDPPHVLPKPAQLPPWPERGWPDVTAVQVPTLGAMLHASQLPVQAMSQQTPSGEHLPLAHSVPAPQGLPFDFGPHEPDVHAFGGLQPVDGAVQVA